MDEFVLVHNTTGRYVNRPGMESSYTTDLACARKFKTREEAEKHRCIESERIESIRSILNCH